MNPLLDLPFLQVVVGTVRRDAQVRSTKQAPEGDLSEVLAAVLWQVDGHFDVIKLSSTNVR